MLTCLLPPDTQVSSEEGGGTRFLLTSRVPVGGQGGTHLQLMERQVGAISAEAARNVVLAAAEDLDQDQAAQLAEACRCVPLVLQMAAEALTAGRVTLQVTGLRSACNATKGYKAMSSCNGAWTHETPDQLHVTHVLKSAPLRWS